MDLFTDTAVHYYRKHAPLADRMRPINLSDFIGQKQIFVKGSPIQLFLTRKSFSSFILWGPPGSGKTTLVNLLIKDLNCNFIKLSAVHSGKKDLLQAEKEAKDKIAFNKQKTVLFIDEIHRFNKLQQDGLLNAVEKGIYSLIGATTENPGFELNSALLSRCHLIVMEAFKDSELKEIIIKALSNEEKGLGKTQISIEDQALKEIIRISAGDSRKALNFLELSALAASERVKLNNSNQKERSILLEDIARGIDKRMILYDKTGDEHYNLISAFIKSIRGSDVQAGVYYLARMLQGGEDPLFIARRLVILASEDIGNADPQASILAVSILQSIKMTGMPESRILLSQLVCYLSLAPKSNACYQAIDQALKEVQRSGNLKVPKKILNAPTKIMKDLDYSEGYHYAHNYENGFYPESFLPESLSDSIFYQPKNIGWEKNLHHTLNQKKQSFNKQNL